MTETVKGVVAMAKNAEVAIADIVVPDPGPGEAVVAIKACGVCHTDLHYREGGINDDFPFLLGHEASGIVESVGEGVTDVAPGDFVILNWRAVCGQCRSCLRGKPHICFDTHNPAQKMTLADGTEVVVKVQRPGIDRLVHQDLAVMAWVAPMLVGRIPVAALANPPALVEVFAHTISEELDFRIEAANMLDVARVFAELGQRQFVVPRPHPRLVTRRVLVMERLGGFRFDDLDSYAEHGVDTHAVVRAGMIGFMEGALIHGVFHGDLHGGNLYVQPDGRTALLDFGITGRLSEQRRRAFVKLLISSTMDDPMGRLAALRDLGALPADSDLDAVAADLGVFDDVVDPTTMEAEELVAELQRVVKALLGYGARMPKELMLFVKNMMFLDGAIARLAPELDLLAEIAGVAAYFASAHGTRLAAEVGMDPGDYEFDSDGLRAALGIDSAVETLTYRDVQERRAIIRRRLRARA